MLFSGVKLTLTFSLWGSGWESAQSCKFWAPRSWILVIHVLLIVFEYRLACMRDASSTCSAQKQWGQLNSSSFQQFYSPWPSESGHTSALNYTVHSGGGNKFTSRPKLPTALWILSCTSQSSDVQLHLPLGPCMVPRYLQIVQFGTNHVQL